MIKLIVGLGNPGPEYELTRHNAGFWFVDQLASSFSNERGFHAHVAKTGSTWLLKPQTFMNRSGLAVGTFARFYRIEPQQVLVVHDELDLLPGAVKMKQGGSHAGHNGLKDIQAALGTQDFWRLRLGIGHPRVLGMAQGVADFVLHNPNDEHMKAIEGAMKHALGIVPLLTQGEMERAAMQLHTDPNRVKKPKPPAADNPVLDAAPKA